MRWKTLHRRKRTKPARELRRSLRLLPSLLIRISADASEALNGLQAAFESVSRLSQSMSEWRGATLYVDRDGQWEPVSEKS